MNVHELFIALSQQKRTAQVTIKNGKLHVGGKALKVGKSDVETDEVEAVADAGAAAEDEAGSDDKDHSA